MFKPLIPTPISDLTTCWHISSQTVVCVCIYIFVQQILSSYFLNCQTPLGSGDTTVNKTYRIACPSGLYILYISTHLPKYTLGSSCHTVRLLTFLNLL